MTYFLTGAFIIGFTHKYRIADRKKRQADWLKYFTYLGIVNILFAGIYFNRLYFHYLCILIIFISFGEILRLTVSTGKLLQGIAALCFFSIGYFGLYKFSQSDRNILFYALFLVTVFDAFSQLTGQLIGKRALIPSVSPSKTLEGLAGGILFTMLTSVLLRDLRGNGISEAIVIGFGVAAFAFLGDISASRIKRIFGVKDFSNLIPGHGGFTDRFDSLVFSGLFLYIVEIIR